MQHSLHGCCPAFHQVLMLAGSFGIYFIAETWHLHAQRSLNSFKSWHQLLKHPFMHTVLKISMSYCGFLCRPKRAEYYRQFKQSMLNMGEALPFSVELKTCTTIVSVGFSELITTRLTCHLHVTAHRMTLSLFSRPTALHHLSTTYSLRACIYWNRVGVENRTLIGSE